ncbi:Uma2 family endonuclease [Butyrivibrio sp. VCD2006]|uniref:Uma2 family endonuclease n=1 Tax=Butyrivibrio sp. VCD2006 TaxID=1280664 RepID=UPI00042A0D6B|nr:Uma2 family endonuclease [Butyrivibrio sp. VCD2006]
MPSSMEREKHYTLDDYYALPDNVRVELIDGKFYDMASPSQIHQEISRELEFCIAEYIRSRKGKCEMFHAPFDVKLYEKKDDIVQPDIFVVCDRDKLDGKRCNGAPDWIIEIASPSNTTHDYVRKLSLYEKAGVREYWIVNPDDKMITVYNFDNGNHSIKTYTFDESIKAGIYDDLIIDFKEIMLRISE